MSWKRTKRLGIVGLTDEDLILLAFLWHTISCKVAKCVVGHYILMVDNLECGLACLIVPHWVFITKQIQCFVLRYIKKST